jgi:GTP-binding protein
MTMAIHSDFDIKFVTSIAKIADWKFFLEQHVDFKLFFFLGRSNVGKSSLINLLFQKKLAHTSQTPGKTRLINIFFISDKKHPEEILGALVDLPGYGHAKISKEERIEWDNLLAALFESLDERSHLFCLQDSRHPFSNMDLIMLDFLNHYPAPRTLILTKMDQCKTQKDKHELNKIIEKNLQSFYFEEKYFVSDKDSLSIQKLQTHVKKLLRS